MNAQVDILLATYQGADYLEDQLQSIVNQSYQNWYLWVRDDHSSDNTSIILEKWVQRLSGKMTLLPRGERLGVKKNFSELMHRSQAPYIVFADQDDRWLPNKIEASLALMKKNEAMYGTSVPLLIHTDLIVADKNLNILDPSFWKYSKINPLANTLNRLLVHNVVTGCTMLMNRSLLQLAMPIPQEAIMHDWWIGLVASAFGHIDSLDQPTLFYRQHGKNDTGAKDWRNLSAYLIQAKKLLRLRGREELRRRLSKTIHQSFQFLERYENLLEPHKKKIVQNYVVLSQSSLLTKRYLFFKHRYFKNTFAKNLGMFLFL